MICKYKTTYADFQEAQRLHMRSTPALAITFWIFLRIFPVLGLIAFILLQFHLLPTTSAPIVAIASGLIAIGVWGLIMAMIRPFSLRRFYKQMKNGRSDDVELELQIHDGQLISRIPGVSEGHFMPAAIRRFVENERVALIYVGKKRFLIIPKRGISKEDWSPIREWLTGTPKKH